MPARFEGMAARLPDRLRFVAKAVRQQTLITPTERKEAALAIETALQAQAIVTRYLAEAPADEIKGCSCAACQHLLSHLAELRKVARR